MQNSQRAGEGDDLNIACFLESPVHVLAERFG
jgi:hypothetical protein